MSKNLVIVESPAKAKTIEKFLGKDFEVTSSMGHIRDLKTNVISIDFDHDYKPIYEVPAAKRKLVSDLKKKVKEAEEVWLASDEDREGEAIAWHLAEELKLDKKQTKRIVFHEITKNAILEAIQHPRQIDLSLVDAQQARRVLDRIVGFELSRVVWKKIKPALSAGRVQSVAVRLIVEREREIEKFKPESSYRVLAVFADANGEQVQAELNTRFKTEAEALSFLESCKDAKFVVEEVQTHPTKRTPAPPFTTSTLQQEAARKLGYSVAQTMMIAQRLYESGKITYMRTDSVNLSSLAINTAKSEILDFAGEAYSKVRQYTTKSKGAQEAHEAIRPTYINEHTIEGSRQDKALYDLIWKRTVACQMADALMEKTTATISVSGRDEKFVAEGEVVKFDGFHKVYHESTDDEESEESIHRLPQVKKNESLQYANISATQRFSQRPARYTEASLVRKMEELGIGRPSTYAPTISTIQNRDYVERADREGQSRTYRQLSLQDGKITDSEKTEMYGTEKAKLFPTNIGVVVNDYLVENFGSIVDYNFTASVEQNFDAVAEGKQQWNKTIDSFYKGFHPLIEESMQQHLEHKVGERVLGTDPKTGKPVSVKIGRYGAVAQIGSATDDEKPQFASLKKNQSMATITLEEALELFKLPRVLGQFEDKEVKVSVGRFGPYVAHNGAFCSLPKQFDPITVTLEEAIELIKTKREAETNRVIKTFDEDPEMQLLNGRYGAYLKKGDKNYKLPRGSEAASLTYADCVKIIEDTPEKPAGGFRRRRASK
ncbi:MAG: type I DNA topoisomerase [Paludibacteraceae bacterium]|nr:type I DNA topoisomerase [Paludibacteraceae bacterium]